MGADGDEPQVYLVRHGETAWSRAGKHTGLTDVPLTDAGRRQAAAIAAKLRGIRFAKVLSSPASRALETARLAGFGEVVEVDPDLHEWDYGDYEGLTTPQIREQVAGWTVWRSPVPGGESPEAIAARADRVIARVRAVRGRVLIFAHGHMLRVIAARWLDLPASEGRHFALDTATVSILGWERETPVVEHWNERCAAD